MMLPWPPVFDRQFFYFKKMENPFKMKIYHFSYYSLFCCLISALAFLKFWVNQKSKMAVPRWLPFGSHDVIDTIQSPGLGLKESKIVHETFAHKQELFSPVVLSFLII